MKSHLQKYRLNIRLPGEGGGGGGKRKRRRARRARCAACCASSAALLAASDTWHLRQLLCRRSSDYDDEDSMDEEEIELDDREGDSEADAAQPAAKTRSRRVHASSPSFRRPTSSNCAECQCFTGSWGIPAHVVASACSRNAQRVAEIAQ